MTEFSWLDSITEEKAIDLVLYFERKFNWSIPSLWTRGDVNSIAEQIDGSPLTDSQWERLASSREWDKGLSSSTEDQLLVVYDLVYGIILDSRESKES